jgi:hypothetical protein
MSQVTLGTVWHVSLPSITGRRTSCGHATSTDLGGGSEQLHDFDVERFDRSRLALEVTRCTHPTALQTQAEIDKRVWQSTRLTHSWDAGFARSIVVRTIAESLLEAVVVIEQSGLDNRR